MCRGSPAKWRLSSWQGAKKGSNRSTVPMICHLLSSEVEAVARGDRSMQQCRESCSATGYAKDRGRESVWVGDHVTAAPEAVTMWPGWSCRAAWRGLAIPQVTARLGRQEGLGS